MLGSRQGRQHDNGTTVKMTETELFLLSLSEQTQERQAKKIPSVEREDYHA